MKIEITNCTLGPINTTINGASYTIKTGNITESVDIGNSIPKNLLDLEARGFIKIGRENS